MKKHRKRQPSQRALCNLKQLAERLGISYYAARGYKKAGVLPNARLFDVAQCMDFIAKSSVVPWHFMKKNSDAVPVAGKWRGREVTEADLVR